MRFANKTCFPNTLKKGVLSNYIGPLYKKLTKKDQQYDSFILEVHLQNILNQNHDHYQ